MINKTIYIYILNIIKIYNKYIINKYIYIIYIYLNIYKQKYIINKYIYNIYIFWHSFWRSIWHLLSHSTWHRFRHSLNSGILGIYSDILSGIYLTLSLASSRGPAVPTEIWRPRLRCGSAHCNLTPVSGGARGWGPAVPTEIWGPQLRSGSVHWLGPAVRPSSWLSPINRLGEFEKNLQKYLDFHPTY